MDAPFHFREEGKTIDRLPLEHFMGEGVLIPVTSKQGGQAITLDDASPYMEKLGPKKLFYSTLAGPNTWDKRNTLTIPMWILKS